MRSYTSLRSTFTTLTSNTNSENYTFGDLMMNDAIKKIIGMPQAYYFLEATTTTTTVANQQNYTLPYNYEKMNSVTVTIGSYKYPVREVPNRDFWDKLQLTTNFTSAYQQWFFVDAGQVYFFPKPSSSGNTITFNYKIGFKDLSNADYTTGTISLTNGSATVTGSGTTFTAAMVGRYLQATTDGYWYKISAYTSATSITLEKTFQGTTGNGLAYTIGEMSPLPEPFQDLPLYYAVMMYYTFKNTGRSDARITQFKTLWDEGLKSLKMYANKTTSSVLADERASESIDNPNLYLTL
jgi:hypothetical protein